MVLVNIIIHAVIVLVLAMVLPGVNVSGFGSASIVAVLLAIINVILRPILLFFTLPLNILTLGLFTFVIDAIILLLVSGLVPGFTISGFGSALLLAIILSIINFVLPG